MPEIYFAQIREDGRLERSVRDERRATRIACIGSGGCTALSLLGDGVERVYAVDANPAQCALIELKKEAMRILERAEYLAFVGCTEAAGRRETYRRIAPELPAYAREYWDGRPDDVTLGVNQCGATERFYRFVGESLRHVVPDDTWRALLDGRTLEEQRALYARHFTSESWRTAVRVLLSRTTHLLFFPAFMFAQATEHDLGQFFAAQFEKEVLTKPLASNYFLSQLLFSSYRFHQPEGAPHYLSEDGYAAARRNLDRLTVVPQTLEAFLADARGLDAFFLSNVFDWAGPEGRAQIGRGLLRAKADRAVLLYRHMLSTHPLSAELRERFEMDEDRGRRLLERERSMMYQRVVVGDVA
jgi:S-adenosylmethionine:diacylglycerol 3-amino-3-carboxypropyl transferase